MLAQAHTFTIDGLLARHVAVEVDVRRGLPCFTIVGLADTAVREARERIHAAIANSGFDFPAGRITANLAPGDLRKAGAGLDLALACALLAASGQLRGDGLARVALFGELGLDGSVRAVRGTLAVAHATRRAGLRTLALAGARAREATLIDGLDVAVVESLRSAAGVLCGDAGDPLPACASEPRPGVGCDGAGGAACGAGGNGAGGGTPGVGSGACAGLDLADVRGQAHAVRALVIAAAGAHNLLLSGPPGVGKTMLAQRLPSILPPLGTAEAVEVTRIHALHAAGVRSLVRARPFRAPHHTASVAGLLGGARPGSVGEAVLAHHGVLFLDELTEFSRASLESLRQPLEDGRVVIARASHSSAYPARFMLVGATNPCPCGYAGVEDRCSCGAAAIARHRRRLSGALLDRIDLLVELQLERAAPAGPTVSSAQARAAVAEARERQARRLAGEPVSVNAHMDARMLARHVRIDERARQLLELARRRGLLSGRGQHRVLRVARTVADLDASAHVGARDVAAALALRPDGAAGGERAA